MDWQNDEACALAAESLQLEHEAYMLRSQGKGKGHSGFHNQRHFDICVISGEEGTACSVEKPY